MAKGMLQGRAVHTLFLTGALSLACEGGATKYIGSHRSESMPDGCAPPAAPPTELELDPFYRKYIDAGGIPVLGSAGVSDAALVSACEIVNRMLSLREDVRESMVANHARVGVLDTLERLTELPEYRDLYAVFPDTDWDQLRGVGATIPRPLASCGEENLLCAIDDPNSGEQLLVHTFSHAIRRLGLMPIDPEFETRLEVAYDAAMASGRFADTFASTDAPQYWAEGVQAWFDANRTASPPDGVHGEVDTRAELLAYDPTLAGLIAEVFPDDDWRPGCP